MFELLFGVSLIALGFITGTVIEQNHLWRLDRREAMLSGIKISDMKTLPPNWHVHNAFLVSGIAVIATDYFKVFIGNLRNLFGGRIRAYETLMERARREAICRMLEEAVTQGANVVWNIRVETMTIGGKGRPGGIEIIVYGTAFQVE